MAEIAVFGIRHHGPGSARSLRRALAGFDPDAVLIEGPADADGLVTHLPGLRPPVALLGWVADDPARASVWPLASFSPEWQALSWAHEHRRHVAFIDLPSSLTLANPPEDAPWRSDPLSLLAEAAGYDDPERWWEDLVEQRDENVFDAIAEAMAAVREAEPTDPETAVREAHMRKVLRAATKTHDRIAVVCGAYHVPALSGKLPSAAADNALLRGLEKASTRLTWVAWSHGRLSLASGYGAGVRSPGWYHHLFTAPDQPVARWLTRISALLRESGLVTSSAHVIEGVRLADTLAVLRGRPSPGLSEVQDATLAVLCEGNELAWQMVTREAVVGELLGEVGDEVPRTPLDADLHATARRLRLKQAATAKELSLDLRKDLDLGRSRLLRRLAILGIPWGELLGQSGTGTFREQWTIRWRPELAIAVVDAARFGNTVEQAAGAKLLAETGTLAQVTSAVEQALVADLTQVLPGLLRLLDERAAAETDVAHLLEALPPLVRSHRYGDVRGTDTVHLGEVIDAVLLRACAGLPATLSGLGPEAATGMRGVINAAHSAIGLLGQESQQAWRQTLILALDRRDLPGLIAGRLVRMLFDAGELTADQVASRLSLALSGGHLPPEQASWAEGLLTGDSLLLLHNPALLAIIDTWVQELSGDAFTEILPVMRRSFGTWTAPERRLLADRVNHLDQSEAREEAEVDLEQFADVLATVDQILGVGA
ncbi:MAG: DUF5682 family protein [Propionibacteriaceae bacterium]|nr:DUF5682 family protein [Propionibacteriaceae bacterium]